MPLKQSLSHLERGIIKPYKLPKLYDCGNSLTDKNGKPTRWFVYYSYLDPETRKFKRFREVGKLNQIKIKADRHKYADLLIKQFTGLLKKGYNPFLPPEEQVFGEVSTLGQAIEAYMRFKRTNLRKKTMKGYKSGLSILLKWAKRRGLWSVPLNEFTTVDLEPYFLYGLTDRKWAATTHNSELSTVRAFFTHWQKRGIIRVNPANNIQRLREEIRRHTAYSDVHIESITSHLKRLDTPKAWQLYQFIRWLYYTCIRPKELLALKVGDIRWQTNTILVPAHVSKNGRAEPVDISPGLEEVIVSMSLADLPADWYIFGNQGKGVPGDYCDARPGPKPVGVNFFSETYRELLDKLGIDKEYTLYAWKHTRNVHLYMKDKDLLRLMRHNRHSDPKVTMRYLRSLGILMDTRLDDERRI
ncbi:tyrosine-type recombinase/integrase [Spirosoma lituiforme]